MKYFVIVVLLLSSHAWAGVESYCDDPAAAAEWSAMADKHSSSDDWQRLHALWLGLCQKVKDGSITHNRAVDLFETQRKRMIREERREVQPIG